MFFGGNRQKDKLVYLGMSNRVEMNPSRIPICEPSPSDNSMAKNRTDQNGAPGNLVKTSAMTMKARPVPSAAWSNSLKA